MSFTSFKVRSHNTAQSKHIGIPGSQVQLEIQDETDLVNDPLSCNQIPFTTVFHDTFTTEHFEILHLILPDGVL